MGSAGRGQSPEGAALSEEYKGEEDVAMGLLAIFEFPFVRSYRPYTKVKEMSDPPVDDSTPCGRIETFELAVPMFRSSEKTSRYL